MFSILHKIPYQELPILLLAGQSSEHHDGKYKMRESTSHQKHPKTGEEEVNDRGTKRTFQGWE